MKFFALILLFVFGLNGYAQYGKKPKNPLPAPPRMAPNGWHFAPGFTFGNVNPLKASSTDFINPDTVINSNLQKVGKLGIYLEAGRFHTIEKLYFFNYLDYGLGYKNLRGAERYTDQWLVNESEIQTLTGENTFSDHAISLYFYMSNVKPITSTFFIQNSFGFLADWHMITNRSNNVHLPNVDFNFVSDFRTELTYKIGFGFKPNDYLLVIPSVQTSLLNVFPWDNGNLTMPYFNSRFKPVVFSLRFMFLTLKRVKGCPPVDAITPEGFEQ